MAFRKHAKDGRLHLERDEWDKAIFNFEWCIELLMKVQSPKNEDACDWLVVWASLPLANIYQFKKKNFKRTLDVWRQIKMRMPQFEDSTSELYHLQIKVQLAIWTVEYQYVVSDLKDAYLKKLVIKEVYESFKTLFQDENAAEYSLLRELSYIHSDNGYYGDALNFIQEAKKYLPRLDDEHGVRNVLLEAFYYSSLGVHDEAHEVLGNYKLKEVNQNPLVKDIGLYIRAFQTMEIACSKDAKSLESNSKSESSDSDAHYIIKHFSSKSENPSRKELRENVIKKLWVLDLSSDER